MNSILVAYASGEGQTAKIAEYISRVLTEEGYLVDVVDTASGRAAEVLPTYPAAILAGSVHVGRHAAALGEFVRANRAWLAGIPSAFVSVSLTAARQDERSESETTRMLEEFLAQTGLAPLRTLRLGGALRYSRYGAIKRFIMRRIARKAGGGTDTSRDFEYTDWRALRQFVLEFVRDHDGSPRLAA